MKHTIKERMAYRFDNYMAKGPWSIFLALLIVFVLGFFLIGIIRFAAGFFIPADVNISKAIWTLFLQLTDPGNMAQDNDSLWYVKIFAVVSGMFGIIFFSAVIAFITTQLDIKLEQLKKGRSKVIEEGHVLLLGWNQQILEIIRELITANESEHRASVVIMSEMPKEEMDDFLNEQISDRKTTHIIARTGNTGLLSSLKRVNAASAKSVIILPSCGYGADENELAQSDAHTLKTTLAVMAVCKNDEEIPDMVVQVYNPSNREIIKNLKADKITVVDPEDMVAKIAVQTSRSTGLSAVYAGLIGFDGCEFYFTKSGWNGLAFKDINYHYPDGIAIGLKKADEEIVINPEIDYVMQDDDEIIILAEDDSTINYSSRQLYTPGEFNFHKKKIAKNREKALIIGWNNKGKTIIEQYQDYLVEGSAIDILPVESGDEIQIQSVISGFQSHNTISILSCDPFKIEELEKLSPARYDSIIILTSNKLEQEQADANTINILLLLRAVIKKENGSITKSPQIITEVLNSDNLELISATGANDAIISTQMVSKVLAQIAEEPNILYVYEEIFTEEGSEIYLKPLTLYLADIPEKCTFADLIKIAQSRNEICLGYRSKKDMKDVSTNFGIVLNPEKNSVIETSDIENIIVIAEDEL